MANNKQFVVIGLGRFGESVAKTLYSLGHDVLVIDMDEDSIQEISDSVTHAVQMDATDEGALRTLGLRNFDVAVVTLEQSKHYNIKFLLSRGFSFRMDRSIRKDGTPSGTRTLDTLIKSQVLYQLS